MIVQVFLVLLTLHSVHLKHHVKDLGPLESVLSLKNRRCHHGVRHSWTVQCNTCFCDGRSLTQLCTSRICLNKKKRLLSKTMKKGKEKMKLAAKLRASESKKMDIQIFMPFGIA